jgi:serine/threonine protein kinase
MAAEAKTTRSCPACLRNLEPEARYCSRCGAAVIADLSLPGDDPAGGISGARPARDGLPGAAPSQQSPSRASVMADPLVGRIVADRYRIVSLLGRGGMGVVYKVEHIHIGKLMAIKLLSGELARDPATVRRFRVEAKAVSKLNHPNTVQVFDFGESARLVYLVMEYLPGRDLGSVISSEGRIDALRAAKICAQVAASVAEAHQRGIIHRDIKPENVMLLEAASDKDIVKVLDFGIAKLRDVEEHAAATQNGHIVGTPYYMAPEQIKGEKIDHRVDIYALGAVLYKALAGVPPFQSNTPMGVLTMHLTVPLTPVRERSDRRDIPPELERVVGKALEKDPARRFQNMDELRDALLSCLEAAGATDLPSRSQNTIGLRTRGGEALATRSDVDLYERRITINSRLYRALAFLLIALAAYGVFVLTRAEESRTRSTEVEPNDEPAQSNPLLPDHPVHGMIGKRVSSTFGDADVYRIETPVEESRVLDLRVSALPNIDLLVELVKKGQNLPVLAVDSGRVGEPEAIPNFTLRGGTYYVRVRERFQGVRWPTENVSDAYQIGFRFVERPEHGETEPNDAFGIAETLSVAEPRQGLLGWNGDRDVYCFERSEVPFVAELSPAGPLDVVLTLIDGTTQVRAVDVRGPGEGESLEIKTLGTLSQPCLEVLAHDSPTLPRAEPDKPYTLRLSPKR